MKLSAVLALAWLGSVVACGSSSKTPDSSSGDGVPVEAGAAVCAEPAVAPQVRQGACEVTLATPGIQEPASKHLPEGSSIEYCSNPPTSGPHYAVWADFRETTQPVPWPYLVHSEEHGGILLLYKCDPACPDIVDQLRQVQTRAPADPKCTGGGKRIIIAPSTTIPTRVAAAAWGATYTADCVDGPTLDAFVVEHRGKGPEDICFAGQIFP